MLPYIIKKHWYKVYWCISCVHVAYAVSLKDLGKKKEMGNKKSAKQRSGARMDENRKKLGIKKHKKIL